MRILRTSEPRTVRDDDLVQPTVWVRHWPVVLPLVDLKTITGDLSALEEATCGRLSSTLDVLLRVHDCGHIDVQVEERWGSYWIHLTGLDIHDEHVRASYSLHVDDDVLDEPTKLVIVGLHLACVCQRAERQRRQIELRASRRTTTKPPDYQIGHSHPRRKG